MIYQRDNSKKLQFDQYELVNFGDFSLLQIGDLICDVNYIMPSHIQYCHEVSYIADGRGIFTVGNKDYKVKKGDIILSSQGTNHAIVSDKENPLRFLYCAFIIHNKDGIFKELDTFFNSNANPVASDKYSINNIFNIIFNELINNGYYSEDVIKSSILQIMIFTYRNLMELQNEEYILKNNLTRTEEILYEIVSYIDSNYMNIEDLTKIGDILGYNYCYLSRAFSHNFGYSIKDYYSKLRFEKASNMLKSGKYSVTEVASKLNYQSVHSFSRAFRNYYKISPTDFIKQMNLK